MISNNHLGDENNIYYTLGLRVYKEKPWKVDNSLYDILSWNRLKFLAKIHGIKVIKYPKYTPSTEIEALFKVK
jgi:hypothetical protein